MPDDWPDVQPGGAPRVRSDSARPCSRFTGMPSSKESPAAAFDALARAGNWATSSAPFADSRPPLRTSCTPTSTATSDTRCPACCPRAAQRAGSLPPVAGLTRRLARDWVDASGLPCVLNPASGQIVTANNEVDRGLPYKITRDWVAPFRASGSSSCSVTGAPRRGRHAAMQADITSLSADWVLKRWVPEGVKELRVGPSRRRSSGRAVRGVRGSAVAAHVRGRDAAPLYGRFYRYAGNERFAGLRAIITDRHSPWFDDRTTPDVVETRDDGAPGGRQTTASSLRAQFGEQPETGTGTRMHAVTFSHALSGGGRVLDWFFSRGPVPVAGDNMTVNKTTTNLRRLMSLPTRRHIGRYWM